MRKMAKLPPPQRRHKMAAMPQMNMNDNDRDDRMRMPMPVQAAPKLSALKNLRMPLKHKRR